MDEVAFVARTLTPPSSPSLSCLWTGVRGGAGGGNQATCRNQPRPEGHSRWAQGLKGLQSFILGAMGSQGRVLSEDGVITFAF